LRPQAITGKEAEERLAQIGITVNKNLIPYFCNPIFVILIENPNWFGGVKQVASRVGRSETETHQTVGKWWGSLSLYPPYIYYYIY
ncbi:hypothetical protein QUF54_05740, partial [Candidatus Marithioploca araucensis]|nr:hypothetical protein [Candidatus Marithioploca araucensis]